MVPQEIDGIVLMIAEFVFDSLFFLVGIEVDMVRFISSVLNTVGLYQKRNTF